mgnify:CR=1 FL=1
MTPSEARSTISIVLYNNEPSHLKQLIHSLLECTVDIEVYFIDNSPGPNLAQHIPDRPFFHYEHQQKNNGYGNANNTVMQKRLAKGIYHLAMNADVYFDKGTLEAIVEYMDAQPEIGLMLPRVLNPDRTDQPLFKLLPKPSDLIFRRFIPGFIKSAFKDSMGRYKMDFADVSQTFDAPYLSGCFMFMRKEALRQTGLFDPRFFLYCEDVDLSRRIRTQWRTVYYGQTSIYHYFQKGSYKHPTLLRYHVVSAVKYFNKHGWFSDRERKRINQETLEAFTRK